MKGAGVEVLLEEATEDLAKTEIQKGSAPPQLSDDGSVDMGKQLLAAWNQAAALLAELSRAHGARGTSSAQHIASLEHKGVIDARFARSISLLREIRNEYVQGPDEFSVSRIMAFVGLTSQVVDRLTNLLAEAPKTERAPPAAA